MSRRAAVSGNTSLIATFSSLAYIGAIFVAFQLLGLMCFIFCYIYAICRLFALFWAIVVSLCYLGLIWALGIFWGVFSVKDFFDNFRQLAAKFHVPKLVVVTATGATDITV